MLQACHQDSIFNEKHFPITLVSDEISQTSNIGGLLRLSDAFGIENIIFCGSVDTLSRKSKRTSRATENWVNFSFENNIESVIQSLRNSHFILEVDITTTSVSIRELKLKTNRKLAVVIGNENYGIKDTVLKMCDQVVHIDMYGKNSSMNVTHATAILLQELTEQILNTKDNAQ